MRTRLLCVPHRGEYAHLISRAHRSRRRTVTTALLSASALLCVVLAAGCGDGTEHAASSAPRSQPRCVRLFNESAAARAYASRLWQAKRRRALVIERGDGGCAVAFNQPPCPPGVTPTDSATWVLGPRHTWVELRYGTVAALREGDDYVQVLGLQKRLRAGANAQVARPDGALTARRA